LIEIHFLIIVHDLLHDVYDNNVLSITLSKDIFIIETIQDVALGNVGDIVKIFQLLIRFNLPNKLINNINSFVVLELYCLFITTVSREVVILYPYL
jgi:hypothetical protein